MISATPTAKRQAEQIVGMLTDAYPDGLDVMAISKRLHTGSKRVKELLRALRAAEVIERDNTALMSGVWRLQAKGAP